MQSVQDAAPEDKLAAQQKAKANATAWITSTPGIHPAVRQGLLAGIQQIPDDQYVGDEALQTLIGQNKLHTALVEEGLNKSKAFEATQGGLLSGAKISQVQAETTQAQAQTAEAQKRTAQMGQVTPVVQYQQQQENFRAALARQATFSNELQKNGLSQLDKMFTDPREGYSQFLAQALSTKNGLSQRATGTNWPHRLRH